MLKSEHQKVLQILASNIKKLRTDLGISQEELALRSGVDRTFISKIERYQANPSLKILIAIAQELDVPFIQLFSE